MAESLALGTELPRVGRLAAGRKVRPRAGLHTRRLVAPGTTMALLGFLAELAVVARVPVLGRAGHTHALIGSALLTIAGTQLIAFGVFARACGACSTGEGDRLFHRARSRYRLEHGLGLGVAIVLMGAAFGAGLAVDWISNGFASRGLENLAGVAATMIIVGIQLFWLSFLLSLLGLRRGADGATACAR